MIENKNERLATPGEQMRAMRCVMEQQITDAINDFETSTGVWIEDMHIGRIKGSAHSDFRITFDMEN